MVEEIKEEIKEEVKPTSKKEEKALGILDQARAEREALEKVRDEVRGLTDELKELKAEKILSGDTNAGESKPEPKEEVSAEEYAKSALQGEIKE